MKLDKRQNEALDAALDNSIKSLFITGQGGTGKSEIIKIITSKLSSDSFVLLAPTQAAALKIGGKTIHSFFKIRPTINIHVDKEEDVVSFCLDEIDVDNVNGKIVIIDEASMLGETMLEGILSRIEPKRLILFGDPEQAKPVKDNEVDWSAFCDKTIILTKNFRVQDPTLDEIISHYRNTGKLLSNINTVDNIEELTYDKDTIYIAHTNETLSQLQKHLLGYSNGKINDVVLTFGACDETIKRKTISGNKSIITNYFNNNDLVKIVSVPRKIDDNLWSCEVERIDKEPIHLNEWNKTPAVVVGNYSTYKRTLQKRFKAAQNLQKKMFRKYNVDKNFLLKKKMSFEENEDLRIKWINYFQLKNSPYARHNQFRTVYKAQGQGFKNVVVDWHDIPGKDLKYVGLSRAMNNLILILD